MVEHAHTFVGDFIHKIELKIHQENIDIIVLILDSVYNRVTFYIDVDFDVDVK